MAAATREPAGSNGVTEVVYLLAASHSGSTLLAMLLGAHPRICTAGELKITSLGDPQRYLCSCGTRIRECGFWNEVGRRMQNQGFAFDIAAPGTDFRSAGGALAERLLKPLHRGPVAEAARDLALAAVPGWRTRLAATQQRNAALMRTMRELTGKPVVVDSSKVGLRLKYLLRNRALNVRVIRLIRDGRGVALTYTDPARFADCRDPARREGGAGGDRREERLSMQAAAREWRRSNEEAEHLLAQLPHERWTTVHYEDLCGSPQATLNRLFAFLGLPAAPVADRFRTVEHHVVGNGMRLDDTAEIALDERWKTALSPGELNEFDAVAGKLNRAYGYA